MKMTHLLHNGLEIMLSMLKTVGPFLLANNLNFVIPLHREISFTKTSSIVCPDPLMQRHAALIHSLEIILVNGSVAESNPHLLMLWLTFQPLLLHFSQTPASLVTFLLTGCCTPGWRDQITPVLYLVGQLEEEHHEHLACQAIQP